jgi:phenylpropionate dioxygenase-like ring-hydroxylating dioxygenase large terminal subunit
MPDIGSHLLRRAANENVLVVRTATHKIKTYLNMCPHRGAQLVGEGAACNKNIVCPYHAWTFDLDGMLLGVPAQKHYLPDIRLQDHRLTAIRTEIWRGLVFVNLQASSVDLQSYLAEFPGYIEDYEQDLESLELVTVVAMEEAINWKLVVENYIEDYHFSFVHPQTLNVFDHKATKTLPTGDRVRIFMPYQDREPVEDCKYPWTSSGGSQQGFIWPSMTIQPAVNHLSIFQITPLAPKLTRIEIPIFQTPDQRREWPLDIGKFTSSVVKDMEEDFAICRELQVNTRSRRYRIGVTSDPHEVGIVHFANTWHRYMRQS